MFFSHTVASGPKPKISSVFEELQLVASMTAWNFWVFQSIGVETTKPVPSA